MATKKITAVTPEAPSAESALYDVALQETNDDGSVQETHQTMTEQEIIAETDAEQAQEVVQEHPYEEVVAVAEKVSPYQEGYAAYLLGAWYGSNTYVGLSEESFEWQRGWNTAYDEDNKPK